MAQTANFKVLAIGQKKGYSTICFGFLRA